MRHMPGKNISYYSISQLFRRMQLTKHNKVLILINFSISTYRNQKIEYVIIHPIAKEYNTIFKYPSKKKNKSEHY